MRLAAVAAVLSLVLTGCQSASAPSRQDASTQTFGDTTITTSGRVRVETGTVE